MGTHNIHFHGEVRKIIIQIPIFSRAVILCPPIYSEVEADPVGVCLGVGIMLSCLHNILSAQCLVNQWLDSYQIFMDILLGHNKKSIRLDKILVTLT